MAKRKNRAVLLFGAPGAGKGTQGRVLGQIPGFFHLSCGDVFRSLDMNSPEGREVYQYSSRGELVPNEPTIAIWKKGLKGQMALNRYNPEEDLLILDGIPRNVEQARMLEDTIEVLKILYLACPDQEKMVDRLKRRAIRENRADDANESVIRHRYNVYKEMSQPVLDFYPQEIINTIDALGSPAEVLLQILQCVIPAQREHFSRQV